MRKSREEAARTRERIIEVAGQEFRRNGIAATGLAGLMASAGLTHGGFYKHFGSKEELVREACVRSMNGVLDALVERIEQEPPPARLQALLSAYLSTAHRDDPGRGCGLAALSEELARGDAMTRAETTEYFRRLVDTIARYLPDPGSPDAGAKAQSIAAAMVGTISVARALNDPALSTQLLESSRETLLQLAAAT
jgi:TetR/AcrR family transcriptional repressor of nem operon